MAKELAVALYHRDHYSTGHMRKVFEYGAFHWGLVVKPAGDAGKTRGAANVTSATDPNDVPDPSDSAIDNWWSFDTTDANTIDPVTFRMTNPAMEWLRRCNDRAGPTTNPKLIGLISIGHVPADMSSSFKDACAFFHDVPLPVRNRDPQEHCVTWVEHALEAAQDRGWLVAGFVLRTFLDWAMEFADDRVLGTAATRPFLVHYNPAGKTPDSQSAHHGATGED